MPEETRTSTYEVLDHAASGIRLQVEFQRRINASLLASRLPFIREITVHNETGSDLPGVELSVGLAVDSDAAHWFACREEKGVPAGGAIHFNGRGRFPEFDILIGERHESALATLNVAAHLLREETQGEEKAGEEEEDVALAATVEIGAFREFLKIPGAWQSIAVFVQPQSRAVAEILKLASDLMLQKTGKGELDGYKTSLARAKLIAESIYQAMREEQIVCGGSPVSFAAVGQKLRPAGQVLGQRFGDCIELSVTYAACCEAAGLHSIVIFTASRAFPAFVAVSELEYSLALGSGKGFNFLEETVIDDGSVISNLVATKAIIPVELAGIGLGKRSLSFRGAAKKATDYVSSLSNELKAAVIIPQCRREGILPAPLIEEEPPLPTGKPVVKNGHAAELPPVKETLREVEGQKKAVIKESEKESVEAVAVEAVAVEPSSVPETPATVSPATEEVAVLPPDTEESVETAIDPAGQTQKAPTRIKKWKQALFDFSLRNPCSV
ncbi:MAG: hypothetical protein LBV29_06020 [Azoarcus sp.]|nr:hypothetical protein [Azoarcus sp.]